MSEPIVFKPAVLTRDLKPNAPPRLFPALPRPFGRITRDLTMPELDIKALEEPTHLRKPANLAKLRMLRAVKDLPVPNFLKRMAE